MTGIVVTNKMTKALTVMVFRTQTHAKYGKKFKIRKKYSVACLDSSSFKIGQEVEIISCAPVSKTISFKVVESV